MACHQDCLWSILGLIACASAFPFYLLYSIAALCWCGLATLLGGNTDILTKFLKPDDAYWRGKVVWITGASSGLGLSLAKQFSKRGSFCILSGRSLQTLAKARDACIAVAATTGECIEESAFLLLPFDLLNSKGIAAAAAAAWKWRSNVHALFCNAGVSSRGVLFPYRQTSLLLQVDLLSQIELAKAILEKHLQARDATTATSTSGLKSVDACSTAGSSTAPQSGNCCVGRWIARTASKSYCSAASGGCGAASVRLFAKLLRGAGCWEGVSGEEEALHLVFTNSAYGRICGAGREPYCTAKSGLLAFAKCLRRDLRAAGIKQVYVQSIMVGHMQTAIEANACTPTGMAPLVSGARVCRKKGLCPDYVSELTFRGLRGGLSEIWIGSRWVLAAMYAQYYAPLAMDAYTYLTAADDSPKKLEETSKNE